MCDTHTHTHTVFSAHWAYTESTDVLLLQKKHRKQEILQDFPQISFFMWWIVGSLGLATNM